MFQCLSFLSFHTVHGVLKTRILKWFSIPFSSGPHSVRPLHHDPFILGGPTRHGLVSAIPWHYSNKLITPSCGNQDSPHCSSLVVHSVSDCRLLWSCMVHSVPLLGYEYMWLIICCHSHLFSVSCCVFCHPIISRQESILHQEVEYEVIKPLC